MKTRKILITAGVYHTEISDQINSLWEDNWSISDIMKETGLSRSSVHSYLPYTKVIYNAGVGVWGADISSNRNQPADIYAWIV